MFRSWKEKGEGNFRNNNQIYYLLRISLALYLVSQEHRSVFMWSVVAAPITIVHRVDEKWRIKARDGTETWKGNVAATARNWGSNRWLIVVTSSRIRLIPPFFLFLSKFRLFSSSLLTTIPNFPLFKLFESVRMEWKAERKRRGETCIEIEIVARVFRVRFYILYKRNQSSWEMQLFLNLICVI